MLPHLHLITLFALDSSCSNHIGPGGPGLYDHLCSGGSVAINSLQDSLGLITNIIRIILYLSGALGIIFLIVGGIYYVLSAGDPSRIKRAKEILVNVITGLVIILVAYAVVTYISSGIG
jgi:hypothetical protein